MSLKYINFEDYNYFPALRARQAEMKGLNELSDARKCKIIPLITLGRWPRAETLEVGVEKASKAMSDKPFFLDLTHEISSLSPLIQELRDPTDGFTKWLDFAAQYTNVIPVIQMHQSQTLRDVVLQARNCEKRFGKLAFRITDFTQSIDVVIAAMSALERVESALVFIDSGYIRLSYAASLAATISTINMIRAQLPTALISTLATSFPSQTGPFLDDVSGDGVISILERQLHHDLGGYSIAAYGDHSSIHAVIYDDPAVIMNWTARIDYPLELDWEISRKSRAKALNDYREIAAKIVRAHPEIEASDIWGEQMIRSAANGGDTVGAAPASWIGVRVNIHLSRQIDFTERLLNPVPDSDEYEEAQDLDY
ncbi:beta family protein [Hydromonas duriensis]|uniref:T4 beta protein n=1 Tax=Hydromonas duriensis TaxID=1527608 RepID=A0A4R6Y9M0_9BURK|nr:beta family protein [Hydromonas duriensis]TDR32154.1 T4 beta protein [Hydromonas duriensis]